MQYVFLGKQAKRGTTVIYDLTLNRDAMGRIDGKTQLMNAVTDNYVYTFDSTGRLTQANKNSATVATYSYDSNSNRNGGTIGAQPTTATYDDQDRLLTYNTLSFTYNANGDLLTKTNSATSTTTQYVYDVFGNLTQVTLPSGAVITYEIDALNRRTGKLVNGVVQKRWIYMDQYRIAAELNAAGTITKRFIYGSKGNIPDYMIASGVKYRIISDHLGSPRLVVKQSDGTLIQRMDHDEYGRVIADTNPGYLPFGFAGGLYDHQTSLIRFGARDYDSEVGRWTSKDPILFNGYMTNLYGYSFNDPVNFIDINGLSPEDVKRIQSEFNSTVASMNRVGARRPGSGLGNGILNNIISTAQTFSNEGYLGCIDQANLTGNQLRGIKTDDKWSFSVVPNATKTHYFIRATSSNPLDPVLTIDPWLNSFGTGR
ncbi:RHS repeat domain-containing protein [Bdellovibrio bacteriovorus]|uniref:RHS repeat domain-containing protein n=1 Tax=Bdellovibrio bacteriovorus TaxID=959 RepID=UPI0035A57ED9